jgi:hypothetical protein
MDIRESYPQFIIKNASLLLLKIIYYCYYKKLLILNSYYNTGILGGLDITSMRHKAVSPDRETGRTGSNNMEKELTCKERVREHYKGRMDDLRRLWEAYQEDSEKSLDDIGNIYDYGLSLDYVPADGRERGYIRYQLSWGGPGDEFRFYLDERREPVKVEYWFLDWFDGAKITPQGKNLDLLKELFSDWKETETIDALIEKAMEV